MENKYDRWRRENECIGNHTKTSWVLECKVVSWWYRNIDANHGHYGLELLLGTAVVLIICTPFILNKCRLKKSDILLILWQASFSCGILSMKCSFHGHQAVSLGAGQQMEFTWQNLLTMQSSVDPTAPSKVTAFGKQKLKENTSSSHGCWCKARFWQ